MRFRVGESNWFYPDFIFWIIDRSTRPETQTICYIDPKGLEMGARGGWSNYKLLSFLYKLAEVGRQYSDAQLEDGTPVRLRFKGAFISTSKHAQLSQAAASEFGVLDNDGGTRFPTVEEFGRAGIFFSDRPDHIERMMEWLGSGSSVLDQAMVRASSTLDSQEPSCPADEIGAFHLYQLRKLSSRVEAALAELVRYSLTADTLDQVVERMQAFARKELLPFLSTNKGLKERIMGSIADPMGIANPCQALCAACGIGKADEAC